MAGAGTYSTDDIGKIWHSAHMKRKNPHNSLTFDTQQESDVICFTHDRFTSQNHVTQRYLLNDFEEKFRKALKCEWMKRFLDRDNSDVRRATVTPHK
jgi:hypothetical protein